MVSSVEVKERERLLEIRDDYRQRGYAVVLHPAVEDLPDFLQSFRPSMMAQKGDEFVVVEVKSSAALDTSSARYMQLLAREIEQHPGWRFELSVTNSKEGEAEESDIISATNGTASLQQEDIRTQLNTVEALASQSLEAALLFGWALLEATLRLLAQKEQIGLDRVTPRYMIQKLAIEGVISRSQYQTLNDLISLRNDIAHGFSINLTNPGQVRELVELIRDFLKDIEINR